MKKYALLLIAVTATIVFGQEKTFHEDFSNNNAGWQIKNFDSTKTYLENGHYVMNNMSERWSNQVLAGRWVNSEKDYSVEAKVMQVSGTFKNGYGIVWGSYRKDDDNQFIISGDGYFNISEKIDGKNKSISDWVEIKDSTIFNPVGEWNIIKVSQVNNRTYFYVNGHKVYETRRLNCSGSGHGLVSYNKMLVKFDYFKITNIDEEINTIETTNNYKLENLGASINTKFEENGIRVSADGKTLFFTRIGDDNLFNKKSSEVFRSDLQADGTWGEAVNMGSPINNKYGNYPINVSPDKNSLYLNSVYQDEGDPFIEGVAKSTFQNGKWSKPTIVNVKNYSNDNPQSSFCIAPDGKHMLMSLSDSNSYGGHDLYISFHENGDNWSHPVNMGNTLNSFAGDFTPFVAGDNKTLFFSSFGHKGYGSADVFMSKRLDDTWLNWSEPVNIGPSVNSSSWDAYYCISAKGDYAYLTASKRKDGYGSQDLYRIKLDAALKPEPVTIISGQVIDAETKKQIDANIIYEDLTTGKEIGRAVSSKENGFQISLPSGKNYGFLAKSKNYISVSQNIDLTDLNEFSTKKMNLAVAPIKKGQVVRINNLFFDLAKYSLRNESRSELNRLVALLKKNTDLNIEIIGHTDSQGKKSSNQKLSENRAKSVLNYLVDNGVSSKRISSKGKGSTDPVESNDTENGRQRNRRVEFKIK